MGRYRPPRQYSSPYITLEGKIRLEDELRFLGYTKRPEVVKALSAAAAEGDRSENAEYIYRKKQLREIDGRLQYLVKRLERLNCVEDKPDDQSKVFFAAWVDLEDENENSVTYRLVGGDETDAKKGWISIDSPVAKGLLKKQVGDEIAVKTPGGDIFYEVMSIRY